MVCNPRPVCVLAASNMMRKVEELERGGISPVFGVTDLVHYPFPHTQRTLTHSNIKKKRVVYILSVRQSYFSFAAAAVERLLRVFYKAGSLCDEGR